MQLPAVTVLSVPIVTSPQKEIIHFMRACTQKPSWHHIVTANNEMLVEAQKNTYFMEVLQQSTANIADSTGVVLAAKLSGTTIAGRSTGVDTLRNFCATLHDSQSVFLLGAAPGIAKKAAQVLQAANKGLRIAGTYSGSPHASEVATITSAITGSGATVLFVAFGAPTQDEWLYNNKHLLPNIRLAMGVGGSFDFIAGSVKRAPKFMQTLGLEWLWRFILQPSRYKRMWRAVVMFPYLVCKQKLFA